MTKDQITRDTAKLNHQGITDHETIINRLTIKYSAQMQAKSDLTSPALHDYIRSAVTRHVLADQHETKQALADLTKALKDLRSSFA